ncbi:hypothetical protein PUNSTDRAFT_130971 [Punctularia strigosozonata HHB-11173 SS5]|uniref:uncharacterized protein n=1 Tax=Punctularia strigosozonata (strain HHB-11173) TaxID=741275 RepID=UPI0004417185|nr:uncharacterized protein PUNSTDRAFT_130971 [Punctularia strigosozonata HHB-11173 SS5]EIN12724.1 hypothetical protein PUNSTDRAFT_130971 [Punctularia strigosozonata HHB-11173 SS5]
MAAPSTHLDDTMGALLIGFTVATVLYGLSLSQTATYYKRFPRDSIYVKSLVAFTLIIQTVITALAAHSLYFYLITSYDNPGVLSLVTNSIIIYELFTAITVFSVQLHFVHRVWQLAGVSSLQAFIALLMFALMFAGLGTGIGRCALLWLNPSYASLTEKSAKALGIASVAFPVLCDICAAIGFTFWPPSSPQMVLGTRGVRKTLQNLNNYLTGRCLLLIICHLFTIALLASMPRKGAFMASQHLTPKLYFLTLLHMLNARHSPRDRIYRSGASVEVPSRSFELAIGSSHTLQFRNPDTAGLYDFGSGAASTGRLGLDITPRDLKSKRRFSDGSLVFATSLPSLDSMSMA